MDEQDVCAFFSPHCQERLRTPGIKTKSRLSEIDSELIRHDSSRVAARSRHYRGNLIEKLVFEIQIDKISLLVSFQSRYR